MPRLHTLRSARRSAAPVERNPGRPSWTATAGPKAARPVALGSARDREAWRSDAAAAIARAYQDEAIEGIVHPGL